MGYMSYWTDITTLYSPSYKGDVLNGNGRKPSLHLLFTKKKQKHLIFFQFFILKYNDHIGAV